jgi:hypothetical protein
MVVMLGYVFGIANKLVSDDVNHVMFFYFLDLGLVLVDSMLYFRNLHYENKASMA